MLYFFKNFYIVLIAVGNFLQHFILLAMRLFWGWEFFSTGSNKLLNIGPIIEFFQSLGIPLPTINAYAVASFESIGGICLILGLASRLVSIPLMVIMVVAMMTAHHEAIINVFNDPQGVIQQTPFNFFLTSLIVFAFGPGMFSLDAIFKYFFEKRELQR